MRTGTILGIILLAVGAWVVIGEPSYQTRHTMVEVSDFKASVRETHVVPKWVGVVAIGAGVVALLASWRKEA
jgi:hypothetical protein